jgi:hypothetical protein
MLAVEAEVPGSKMGVAVLTPPWRLLSLYSILMMEATLFSLGFRNFLAQYST